MEEDAFNAFEHQGWERLAQPYHAYYANLTTQSHGALLDAVDVQPGSRFLDVASGPGYLAAAAAERGADVVGVDVAEAMVEHARCLYPSLTFRVGSAEDLPFADESFDAVGISFGLFHFAHPEKALAEAFRVLRAGGRIAFTAWAAADKAIGLGMVLKAVEAHGQMDVGLPEGPLFFRFSNWRECERVLLDSGFIEPHVQDVDQTWRIRAPETPLHALMRGGVRIAAILKAQTQDDFALIEKAVAESAAAYRNNEEFHVPMPCVLASARKP
ncbi:methyltransferase type 11 [Paraburkholderia ginsengiterrae]|uniref:Methyltransferase type 11 n=1 Tax=Paraburkholderia ginsengiterrae TaxID=1462993 RepID=A0A1A9NEB1_9BURK|nr:methyltransferase domain-containing protein [Paraburkholderia ginsengiterrae]OAJ62819.1 methyltransferase type 11 [Paraburkholderia ginsengiterrae]OAJ64478.1 methyltransferase type 11 [Paraburkholderia ginsengiterrae]